MKGRSTLLSRPSLEERAPSITVTGSKLVDFNKLSMTPMPARRELLQVNEVSLTPGSSISQRSQAQNIKSMASSQFKNLFKPSVNISSPMSDTKVVPEKSKNIDLNSETNVLIPFMKRSSVRPISNFVAPSRSKNNLNVPSEGETPAGVSLGLHKSSSQTVEARRKSLYNMELNFVGASKGLKVPSNPAQQLRSRKSFEFTSMSLRGPQQQSLDLKKQKSINLKIKQIPDDRRRSTRNFDFEEGMNRIKMMFNINNPDLDSAEKSATSEEEDQEELENIKNEQRMKNLKKAQKVFHAIYLIEKLRAIRRNSKKKTTNKFQGLPFLGWLPTESSGPRSRFFFLPFYPTDKFKTAWNFCLFVTLLFSGIFIPFRVCIVDDEDEDNWTNIDLGFDLFFLMDMIINFVSAYYDEHGELICDFKSIFWSYLSGWFLIDFVAIFPFDMVLQSLYSFNSYNKLIRLFRLPRLYRLLKILRMSKMGGIINQNNYIKMNSHYLKLINILLLVIFTNHIMSCFWYFTARLDEFSDDTWVVRFGLLDEDYFTKYITSYYWGFQTLTTIGYGDFPTKTILERLIAIMYMIFGVGLYSFAIGNLSSLLTNMDRRAIELKTKINNFNEFAKKMKVPAFLSDKILRFFEVNFRESLYSWIEPKELLTILPSKLRNELMLFSNISIIKEIYLLTVDVHFTIQLIPHFKFLRLKKCEILYREDDPPEEVYFILSGKINYVTESGKPFFSILKGSYFGELEILDNVYRTSFTQAKEDSLLIVIDKEIFLKAMKESKAVTDEVDELHKRRKQKYDSLLQECKLKVESARKRKKNMLLKSTEYYTKMILSFDKELKSNNKLKNISQNLFVINQNATTDPFLATPVNKEETGKFSFSSIIKRLKEKKEDTPKNSKSEKKNKLNDSKISKKLNSVAWIASGANHKESSPSSEMKTDGEEVKKKGPNLQKKANTFQIPQTNESIIEEPSKESQVTPKMQSKKGKTLKSVFHFKEKASPKNE